MNYLSHAYRFLDRPLFAIGTILPDLLSVVDRRVRLRRRRIEAAWDHLSADEREMMEGTTQHVRDDDRFHNCPVFLELEAVNAADFRSLLPDRYDHRPGFMGHISAELLLDDWLMHQDASLYPRFRAMVASVSPATVQQTVNAVAARSTDRLTEFIPRFLKEDFFRDYADSGRLWYRLNQVLRRVTLPPLPEAAIPVLDQIRERVFANAEPMLEYVAGKEWRTGLDL